MLFLDLLLLKLTVGVHCWKISNLTNKDMSVANKYILKSPAKKTSFVHDGEKYSSRLLSNRKRMSSDLAIFRNIYVDMDINNIRQKQLIFEIFSTFYRNLMNSQRSNLDQRSTEEKKNLGKKRLQIKVLKSHNEDYQVKPINKKIKYLLTNRQNLVERVQAYYKYNWTFQICSIFTAIFSNNFQNLKFNVHNLIIAKSMLNHYLLDLRVLEKIAKYMLDFDLMLKKRQNINSDPEIHIELPFLEKVLLNNVINFLVTEVKKNIKPLEYSKIIHEHIGLTETRVFVDASGSKQLPEHITLDIAAASSSNNMQPIIEPDSSVFPSGTTNKRSTEKTCQASSCSFLTHLRTNHKPIHHSYKHIKKNLSLIFINNHATVLTSNKEQLKSALQYKIILSKLLTFLFQNDILKFKVTPSILKHNCKIILLSKYSSFITNILISFGFRSKYMSFMIVICRSNLVHRRTKFWLSKSFRHAYRQFKKKSTTTGRFLVLVPITRLLFKYDTTLFIPWTNSSSVFQISIGDDSLFRTSQCKFTINLLFLDYGLKICRIKYLDEISSSFTDRKLFNAKSSNPVVIHKSIKRDLKSRQQLTSHKTRPFSNASNDPTNPILITSSLIHSSAVVTSKEYTTQLRSSKGNILEFSNVTKIPKQLANVNSSTINLTQTVDLNKAFNLIEIIIQPAILFTGTIGNAISVIIFRSKEFNIEVAFYIPVFLSILEMFTNIIVFFDSQFYVYLFGQKISNLNFIMCKTFHYLKVFVKSTSAWTIAMMSAERFIAVKFPFKAKVYITKYKVLATVFVCCLVEVILNFSQLSGRSYENDQCIESYQNNNILVILITLLNGWLIPTSITVLLNTLIIIYLRRQSRIRNILTREDRSPQFRQINVMLFTIIISKFIFELPLMIQHVMHWVQYPLSDLLNSIFIALGFMQHSLNAFVYSFVSKSFRSVILRCFRSKC